MAMMKPLAFLFVLVAAFPAWSQSPFDMSPERPAQPAAPAPPPRPAPLQPAPQTAPQAVKPVAPSAPAPFSAASPPKPVSPPPANAPAVAPPASAPPPLQQPNAIGGTTAPAATSPTAPANAPANVDVADGTRRYLVPAETLRINGEIGQRSWSIHLTAEQAAAPTKLHFSYQNSVFVAPEASRLSVNINDVEIYKDRISASDRPAEHVIDLPAGILKAGSNVIRFGADQRHRTDCTIESTFELWTAIDPEKTYLSFDDPKVSRLNRLDDLRAVGVDGHGNTRFRLIVPALDQIGATDVLMRLTQALSLMSGMPNQSFDFQKSPQGPLQAGELMVFVGTPEELRPLLPNLTAAASSAAVASFAEYPANAGASVLALSGPSWPALQGLIDSFAASVDTTGTQRRETLATANWRGLDTPFLFSNSVLDFSSLGIQSQEFSGRLFRTEFTIGVPADFYANAYGEARILLDAAYVPEVQAGSHIDVFVNGNIASTIPITSNGGAVLRHLPIKLTLQHFKPGVNTIVLEASLITAADRACAPGATGENKSRFALFGSSQFEMPDFARIAQVPNLAATAGTGFPYGLGSDPVSLFLGRIDEKTLSSTATLLGKIAVASHRVMPISVTISTARIAGRNAIFVGSISEFPANVLSQLKIDPSSRNSWSEELNRAPAPQKSLTLQDWQQRNGDNFISRQFSGLADWAKRNFDLSATMLRFAPPTDEMYSPPKTADMILAQDSDPTELGTWTALISTDDDSLYEGMNAFSTRQAWDRLAGRITVYNGPNTDTDVIPVSWFRFMPTAPFSIFNARLIAANWLSDNIMSYGLLLVAGAVLLGLATGGMLSRLGRK
ncbi:cellulose synthase subunit [Neorhizobium alkalisoli]|uniref:Cyclic di-GMP-binding protein n=2 Tax=Neorhizobium alkalisoli TaxID=528178 RepID=A0A561QSF8_9HYPH|nr:cellulose synthase subunit [Neorhizobium alkalisoli]